MDLGDFLLVRRKAALVLRTVARDPRLSFAEVAILCHLTGAAGGLRPSALASYEGVIRTTMNHRLRRLAGLGLVWKAPAEGDGRGVVYGATDRGSWQAGVVLEAMAQVTDVPDPLASASPERLGRYVEAAGRVPAGAADLALLALWAEGRPLQVTELQRRTGLLQPTCSMALVSLGGRGLVEREVDAGEGAATALPFCLTALGRPVARGLAERVRSAVVHQGLLGGAAREAADDARDGGGFAGDVPLGWHGP